MLPKEPKRQYQAIGLKLHGLIAQGTYEVGDRLPPEREIALLYGVNRAVVREALIMLELEGLIEIRKGSGIYVIAQPEPQSQQATPESIAKPDDIGPFEYLQARQLFESQLAELAALQVTKNDIKAMNQALVNEQQALASGDNSYDGDKNFHLAIAKATQNSLLEDMLEALWQRRTNSPMWKKLHTHIINQSYRQEWLGDHQKILTAIKMKNPQEAKESMWQHLENVKQRLFELSDVNDPEFDGYLFASAPLKVQQ
ncbi:FCD domain-containing protein [Celerinatantimonas diazotrophica]|uniref:GntR family transcriptional regulator n=1 Tax=Celerinatantimonas diazotrophica TaxID=412034 RepID=A0A4R1K525_9GAMM|nr:FCD domain-containing protein [Celerinatantimonas diazotrophica]TCK59047.1 GntR family transcriptional regulator [Celerinatantimonas diazotrophica]CAG9297682.1 HTH-type transcriptional regulator LutR [Celerinatantimonas diazotrophica]